MLRGHIPVASGGCYGPCPALPSRHGCEGPPLSSLPMRLGIRWKLMLAIGMPLIALSALTLAISFEGQKAEALTRMRDYLSMEARYYAASYNSHLDTVAQIARSMASFMDEHPDVSEAELYEMLGRNVEQAQLIYGSCIAFEPHTFQKDRRLFAPYVYRGAGTPAGQAGPEGRGLLRMDVANAYDYMDTKWRWFHDPRETGQAMWTEPFFDDGAGDVIMCTYVAPFFDGGGKAKGGKFRGTVNIDVRLVDLQDLAGTLGSGSHAREVAIISHRGTFVSWSDPDVIMRETIQSFAERTIRPDLLEIGRRMISGQSGTEDSIELGGRQPSMVSYAPIPATRWSLATAVPRATIMAPVILELRDRAAVAAGMIAVIVGVILAIGIWLTRPLERLAAAVKRVDLANLGAPPTELETAGIAKDEIGDLAHSFAMMTAQLREQVAALTEQTKAREAVESELRVAREIQRSLLPRTFPPFPDHREFDLHAFNGAARRVAGDFYDFFFLPDGRLALVIADVCGKGVPAAMFMAVARTVVRNLALAGRPPGEVLTETNRLLLADNTQGLFVTLIVAYYTPSTGEMVYANGGHPRPYVLSASSGRGRRLFGHITGTIVGALDGELWSEDREVLAPGQTIVMFTDGVPDARRPGGPMFGEARLAELLTELAAEPVDRLCARIVERLDDFASRDWPDDVTLLALHRNA